MASLSKASNSSAIFFVFDVLPYGKRASVFYAIL
jgi:hypothetical protein